MIDQDQWHRGLLDLVNRPPTGTLSPASIKVDFQRLCRANARVIHILKQFALAVVLMVAAISATVTVATIEGHHAHTKVECAGAAC
jgi:hypothetical protein